MILHRWQLKVSCIYYKYFQFCTMVSIDEQIRQIRKFLLTHGEGAMADVVERIANYIEYSISPVLIIGESGSGKEYIAKILLCEDNNFKNAKIVSENCATSKSNPELLESKLFGHVKGAFTGANSNRKGLLRSALHGIFLDEIDKSSIELQNYLLRYLREGEIRPVGSDQIEYEEKRKKLIFASSDTALKSILFSHTSKHQNRKRIRSSEWYSKDFLNRIKCNVIVMPPLRERLEDLGLITDFLIKQQINETGIKITHISGHAIQFILDHGWPGNIAELSDFIANGVLANERHRNHLVLHLDGCMNYYLDNAWDVKKDWLEKGQIKGKLVDRYLLIDKISAKPGVWGRLDDLQVSISGDIPIKNLPRVFDNTLDLYDLQIELVAKDDGVKRLDEIIDYFDLKKSLRTKKAICEKLDLTRPQLNRWLEENHLDY